MSSSKQTWRLFTTCAAAVGERVLLPGDEHHYAHHVLRLGVGERVEVGDHSGFVATAVITRCDKKGIEVEIEEILVERAFPCQVTLFLALPKPSTLEEVVGLAAEMGVSSLVVFRTQRCQSKAPVKVEKLERASQESLRISKAFRAPTLRVVEDFGALQGLIASCGPAFLCDESSQRMGDDLGSALRGLPKESATNIALIVGPESSFEPWERERFLAWGAKSVSLGPLVLRVPTAVAYALGVAMSHFNSHYSP
ncbi:MAG: 16S rRNA (uracil(1498)-N(3))-methyltransferase [Silvanigrellales bacterium]|nr:16S rRNA (uracil(1498)-N(3))-methyltransferase [Silvanigrellales bacterium]